jgi:acyl dehydratase
MGEATITANPKGLFKRDTKGVSVAPVTVQIERGRIRFFAQVLGEMDPLFTDLEAARAMGHPDIAAPPSFFMVVEAMANEERRRQGVQAATELVGCDFRYLLHGDEHYSYEGLIYAGDTVALSTQVLDFYDKKGGAMEFVVFESLITHAERGVLVRARRTLLHRLG